MTRFGRYCRYAAYLLFCCTVTAVWAGETSLRRYQLLDQSSIQLQVPAAWKSEVQKSPEGLPPTIVFGPKTGASFMVMMTPLWPRKKDIPPASPDKIRELTEQAAAQVKPQVVEKTIRVKKLQGSSGIGYYFSVTDRAPKPGEYKYMTQGMILIGEMLTTFTIFTNEGQESIVSEGLAMVKGAVHDKAT